MKQPKRKLTLSEIEAILIRPPIVWIVIGVMLAAAVVCILSPGMDDMGMWEMLISGVAAHGAGYVRQCLSPALCDGYPVMYPPLYVGIFAAFTGIFHAFAPLSAFFVAKYAIFTMYLLSGAAAVLYGKFVTPKQTGRNAMLFAAVMFVTTVSVFLNAEPLGLVDVFTFPFFILAMLFYNKKQLFWFGALYAVTFLTKWQTLLYLPIALLYILVTDGVNELGKCIAGLAIGGLAVWATLMFFPLSLFERSLLSAANHQPISAAPNLPWLSEMLLYRQPFAQYFGVPARTFPFINTIDVGSVRLWGIYWVWKALSIGSYLMVTWIVLRNAKKFMHREGLLVGMTMVTVCYFLFATGAHENHLMPAVLVGLLLFLTVPNGATRLIYRSLDGLSAISLFLWDGVTGKPLWAWDPHAFLYPPTVAAVIVSAALITYAAMVLRHYNLTVSG